MMTPSDEYCDAIGVGFGPSNMAIAVAHESLKAKGSMSLPKLHFLEKKTEFDWHPDMLLDGANMQVSFLKDLITSVDPTSPYTFLNYLKETDGLNEFINLRTFYPSRIEYRNYLRWAAEKLGSFVTYRAEVVDIRPNMCGTVVNSVAIDYLMGERIKSATTRHVVFACGAAPKVPSCCASALSDRVIHSGFFLSRLVKFFPDNCGEFRFAVIGSGQSAAEMFHHLYSKYPNSQITIVTSGIGFKPADASEFVNTLFYQSFIDDYYAADESFRLEFLKKHYDANYSVVDSELISEISRDIYSDNRFGAKRLRHLRFCTLTGIHEDDGIHVEFKSNLTSERVTGSYDAVFLGTGYTFDASLSLLEGFRDFIVRGKSGAPIVNRDYSLATRNMNVKIYLLGPTERTHGLSSTLLSVLPFRAQEVLQAIVRQRNKANQQGSSQKSVVSY